MTDAPGPFKLTEEYRHFVQFCDACSRNRYIGLCYGNPGVGKTLSGRHYAKWDTVETLQSFLSERRRVRARRPEEEFGPVPWPEALLECTTVFYTPEVSNSPLRVKHGVRELRQSLTGFILQARDRYQLATMADDAVRDYTRLIIVDEADRLNVLCIEQLREIYDHRDIGMVLMGMPGIEKRLSRYPQLYSRVGFVHRFAPLKDEELRTVLLQIRHDLGLMVEESVEAEIMATLIRITSGNFRLIQRLFSQIARVMDINQFQFVTQQVIEAARESLVIGVV